MVLVGQVLDEAWTKLLTLFEGQSLSQPQLISAVVIIVLGFVGGRITGELLRTLLKMTALDDIGVRSDTQLLLRRLGYRGTLSDFVADFVTWVIYLLAIFSVFYLFGFRFITGYSELLVQWASRLLLALVVFLLGSTLSTHVEHIVIRLFRGGRMAGAVDRSEAEIPVYVIAGRAARYVGYLVTFIIALGVMGADLVVLNLLVGVFGIGIVFLLVISFRDLTRNIAISIYLQLSRVFVGGEWVTVDGREGRIVGIRPLYTKIQGEDGTFYVPNTRLVSEIIEHRDQ